MQGWIKDYRKELESDIWMMPPLYHRVWQYLKYRVNHEPRKVPQKDGSYITVGKGETITSMRQIAEGVKWMEYGVEKLPSSKTIRDVLNVLQKFGMITRESNSLGTRIKVVNYELYQGSLNGESNNEETAKKQRLPTNKNDKNDKNKYIYTHDELEILTRWNEQKITQHNETENMKKAISKALKKHGKEKILEAIQNYSKAYYDSSFYYSHRWRLDKFLTQSNGISDWIEGGQRHIEYQDHIKNEKSKSEQLNKELIR